MPSASAWAPPRTSAYVLPSPDTTLFVLDPVGYLATYYESHPRLFDGISHATLLYMQKYQHGSLELTNASKAAAAALAAAGKQPAAPATPPPSSPTLVSATASWATACSSDHSETIVLSSSPWSSSAGASSSPHSAASPGSSSGNNNNSNSNNTGSSLHTPHQPIAAAAAKPAAATATSRVRARPPSISTADSEGWPQPGLVVRTVVLAASAAPPPASCAAARPGVPAAVVCQQVGASPTSAAVQAKPCERRSSRDACSPLSPYCNPSMPGSAWAADVGDAALTSPLSGVFSTGSKGKPTHSRYNVLCCAGFF